MQKILGAADALLHFLFQWPVFTPLLDLHKGHKQQEDPPCARHVQSKCWPGDRGQDPATTFLPGPSVLWAHLLQQAVALPCMLAWAEAGC